MANKDCRRAEFLSNEKPPARETDSLRLLVFLPEKGLGCFHGNLVKTDGLTASGEVICWFSLLFVCLLLLVFTCDSDVTVNPLFEH